MRTLKSIADDTFRVKAYAGTNGVLLGCDLDPLKRRNFLGFAIEQKEGTKPWQWLLNSLTFPGLRAHYQKMECDPIEHSTHSEISLGRLQCRAKNNLYVPSSSGLWCPGCSGAW